MLKTVITKEQCKALVDFTDENSLNNKSALNGLYKNLLKECNALYKTKESLQKAVMESLKLTLGKLDTIEARVHNLKVMRKYLSMITPCIVSSNITSKMLALVKKNKKGFQDVIYFNQRIGSESEYGVAYLNTGVGKGSKLVFSTKITPENNKNEIQLLEKMSYAVQNHITPNFPIIYKVLHCKHVKEKKVVGHINIEGINDIIKNHRYYVILNELAKADLFHFLEKEQHSSIEYESVVFQIFIALHTFHIQTNHIHNDAHFGNFLYHKITKGGYWHYKYNNTDIYVPNTGYLVVIWDPGLAHKIVPNSEYLPYIDFHRVYKHLKYDIENRRDDSISRDFLNELEEMMKYIIVSRSRLNDVNSIMKYLEKKPKFKNILFSAPLNSHIINKIPYYL